MQGTRSIQYLAEWMEKEGRRVGETIRNAQSIKDISSLAIYELFSVVVLSAANALCSFHFGVLEGN